MLPGLTAFSAEWDGIATVGDHYCGLRRWQDGTWTVEVWLVNRAYHRQVVYHGSQFPEDARGVWLRILNTGTLPGAVGETADSGVKEVV